MLYKIFSMFFVLSILTIPVFAQSNETITNGNLEKLEIQINKTDSTFINNQQEIRNEITEIKSNIQNIDVAIANHDKGTMATDNAMFGIGNMQFTLNFVSSILFTLIGIIGGHRLSTWNANTKERKEIEKTKEFLNKDFNFIINQLILTIHKSTIGIADLQKNDDLVNQILASGTPEKINGLDPLNFVGRYLNYLDFVSWDLIVYDGSLKKLKLDEMILIKNMHDYVTEVSIGNEKYRDMFVEKIRQYVKTPIPDPLILKSGLIDYLQNILKNYNQIYKRLQDLDKIEWMKLPKL